VNLGPAEPPQPAFGPLEGEKRGDLPWAVQLRPLRRAHKALNSFVPAGGPLLRLLDETEVVDSVRDVAHIQQPSSDRGGGAQSQGPGSRPERLASSHDDVERCSTHVLHPAQVNDDVCLIQGHRVVEDSDQQLPSESVVLSAHPDDCTIDVVDDEDGLCCRDW